MTTPSPRSNPRSRPSSRPSLRPAATSLGILSATLLLLVCTAWQCGPAQAAKRHPQQATDRPQPTWDRTKAVRSPHPLLPDDDRQLALGALVVDLLRAAPSGRLPFDAQERAALLGLSLEHHRNFVWLVEPIYGSDPESQAHGPRGDGMVAVRLGPLPTELVLEAPHPFYDSDTGGIVGALFDRGGIRAAIIASAQRYDADDVDPTHQIRAPFQALTDAVARALPDPLIVQVHGFSKKTTTAQGVISDGRARSGGDARLKATRALAEALPASDLRDPKEEPLLAAYANVQSWILADRARFLHLELNRGLRRQLRHEVDAQQRLAQALLALAAQEGSP